MIPPRAESSIVSLPPRERALAKRRAKAMKLGLSPSVAGKSPAKGTRKRAKAPAPLPTLAATRKRRAAADVAYLNRPDGYHIKRVVRRLSPGPAPPVPYLPGEEDIPHSDAESDDSDATALELAHPANFDGLPTNLGVSVETEDSPTEPSDLVDYDAEGEDEDEDGDGDIHMQDLSLADFSFYTDLGHAGVPGSTAQPGTASFTRPADLVANASQDDIQAVFGSLDTLRFGTDNNHFPGLANTYSHPVPDRLAAHARYLFGDGQQYSAQDQMWGPFTMRHFNTTADNWQARPPSITSTHCPAEPCSSSGRSAYPPPPPTGDLPHPCPPSRVATPAPWIAVPEAPMPILHQPTTPLPRSQPIRYTLASQTGAPIGSPFSLHAPTPSRPRPRLSTRELVSQAQSQAQSPHLPISPPPADLPNASNLHAHPSLDLDDALPFGLAPLRLSLNLDGTGDNTDDAISEDEEQRLDPNASCPSTPVALEDTDVGLTESSAVQVTQARCRASRFLNARRLVPHWVASSPRRIPTALELKAHVRKLYKLHHRKHRRRYPTPAPETSHRRKRAVLRAGVLTPEQQMVMAPTEYHLFKDIICDNPWPEDREACLQAAEKYATNITGISGPDVFTESFLDTVFYKMSANRGNSLTRIEVMMEQEFAITTVDKPEIYQLLNKDQFLYPNVNRDPSQYFRVGALGAALEVILFKSAKPVGLAFMEEFCQPDDPEKCARWHRKLRDRTARKGVSPGAIAFAATQMYWALEKMYLGTNIHFNEGHFRSIWDRYFRALIKLPHLGQLRVDLLDRLKEYYMDHWPSDERDDDDDSFPAW